MAASVEYITTAFFISLNRIESPEELHVTNREKLARQIFSKIIYAYLNLNLNSVFLKKIVGLKITKISLTTDIDKITNLQIINHECPEYAGESLIFLAALRMSS